MTLKQLQELKGKCKYWNQYDDNYIALVIDDFYYLYWNHRFNGKSYWELERKEAFVSKVLFKELLITRYTFLYEGKEYDISSSDPLEIKERGDCLAKSSVLGDITNSAREQLKMLGLYDEDWEIEIKKQVKEEVTK